VRVLVTGASGFLGQTLVPRLAQLGHFVVGLDPVPSPTTSAIGTIEDRAFVRELLRRHELDAVVHAGALHKPHVATHEADRFMSVNVQGTLNLLEESVAPGSAVKRFVFTSTTSLMISRKIREGRAGGALAASWITEDMAPLLPRNIYGVSKLGAEQLCRLYHEQHGLPLLILRTSRFFPEEDDMAHAITQTGPNTKLNELLFRRIAVEDVAEAHMLALSRAPALGFDTLIVSAKTPFSPSDCEQLIQDAPAVVARYFPQYPEIYARLGWSMFDSIDRVYVATRCEQRLGFVCRTNYADALAQLSAERA
jgi:UDP-glucose 4-epimerase